MTCSRLEGKCFSEWPDSPVTLKYPPATSVLNENPANNDYIQPQLYLTLSDKAQDWDSVKCSRRSTTFPGTVKPEQMS